MFRVKDGDVFPGTSPSFFHSHNLLKTNHLPSLPNNYKKPQKKRLLFFFCLYPETTCRTPGERNLFYRPFALCMVFFKLQAQDIAPPLSLPETANDQNRITLRGLPDVAITHANAYEIRLLFKFSCRCRTHTRRTLCICGTTPFRGVDRQ